MRIPHRTRRPGLALTLLLLASSLSAQTVPWKPFASPADGFHAQFPSDPEFTKSSVAAGGQTFELHSYVAEVGTTALYIGVCDYGAPGKSADPEDLLASAKQGAIEQTGSHLLTEKLDLGANPEVAFEAESAKLHFSVRMFMAGSVLYQVMVASPLTEKFSDTARFLDSFQLAAQVTPAALPDWKPYRYPADGFSASFPFPPAIQKQPIATDAGQFQLRTFVVQDSSAILIAAVCDYGASAAGKDADGLLESAKAGSLINLKAHMVSEKKLNFGDNHGVSFEAANDSEHISARLYLAGSTLYQTVVAAPLNGSYADTARFLDSFQLLGQPGK